MLTIEGSEELVSLFRQLKKRDPKKARLVLQFVRGLVEADEKILHSMKERA